MQFEAYHNYLRRKSLLGDIYRNYLLHPTLVKYVGKTFLDVGCGLGDLLRHGSRYSIGIDINPYNVKYINNSAQEENDEQNIHARMIPESGVFPVHDMSFPAVICDQVIEHIIDPARLLSESCRVLQADGYLLFGVPQEKGFQYDDTHVRFYSHEMMKNLPFAYDLPLEYIKHFYFPLPWQWTGKFLRLQSLYVLYKRKY